MYNTCLTDGERLWGRFSIIRSNARSSRGGEISTIYYLYVVLCYDKTMNAFEHNLDLQWSIYLQQQIFNYRFAYRTHRSACVLNQPNQVKPRSGFAIQSKSGRFKCFSIRWKDAGELKGTGDEPQFDLLSRLALLLMLCVLSIVCRWNVEWWITEDCGTH